MTADEVIVQFQRQLRVMLIGRVALVIGCVIAASLLIDVVPSGLEALSRVRVRWVLRGWSGSALEVLWLVVVLAAGTTAWAALTRRLLRCPACGVDPRAPGVSTPAVCSSCDVSLRGDDPVDATGDPVGRFALSPFGVVVAVGVLLFGGFLALLALSPAP
jgi:hypothetical protein